MVSRESIPSCSNVVSMVTSSRLRGLVDDVEDALGSHSFPLGAKPGWCGRGAGGAKSSKCEGVAGRRLGRWRCRFGRGRRAESLNVQCNRT